MKQLLPLHNLPPTATFFLALDFFESAHFINYLFRCLCLRWTKWTDPVSLGHSDQSYFSLGSGEWLTEKLAEAEIGVAVQKVSGNCSSTEKERAMESFRTG